MTPTNLVYQQAMNRLCKWRTILASWQLGTRTKDDPECQAVRDHREATLILRAEVNALFTLLVAKRVFTLEEYEQQMVIEAGELEEAHEKRFPGAKATDVGIQIDVTKANAWMSKFPK